MNKPPPLYIKVAKTQIEKIIRDKLKEKKENEPPDHQINEFIYRAFLLQNNLKGRTFDPPNEYIDFIKRAIIKIIPKSSESHVVIDPTTLDVEIRNKINIFQKAFERWKSEITSPLNKYEWDDPDTICWIILYKEKEYQYFHSIKKQENEKRIIIPIDHKRIY